MKPYTVPGCTRGPWDWGEQPVWGRAQVPGRQSPNCLLAEHEAREIPWQSSIEDSMAFTAEGVGSIPGQETAIPQAMQHSQKNLKKQKHEAQKTSTEEGSPRQRLCLPGSCRDAPVDPSWATRHVEARMWEGPPSPEQTAPDVPSGRGTLTRHLSSDSFRISENRSSWARSSVL